MGKSNARQSKMSCEQRCQTCIVDPEPEDARPRLGSLANPTQYSDVRSVFLDLKHRLTTIDTKIGLLTDKFDHLKDKVDKPDEGIDQLERCTLEVEDAQQASSKRLLQMAKVLEVIRNKNEDLEAWP
ncbi:hypothetical protein NDU88_006549 [Pleurodeles waltl]|uniref:Uncharacterized protein n=1 Tax=Pleurodeles waltl TaxID=8319 RepID=A0AAV7LX71_PLEWA|nr:hypothetical protein NDU88_006549 [Pleurodeles waltl]